MLTRSLFVLAACVAVLAMLSVASADDYSVRCAPGMGQLPRDGVICLAFRPSTHASDFAIPEVNGKPYGEYFSDDQRALAADCPDKDPNTDGEQRVILRKSPQGALEFWLILKGQMQSGKHKCCAAVWANGDGKVYKWCPDMPPLQV